MAGWLKARGYEESLITEQIDKVRRQDRVTLLDKANGKHEHNGNGWASFVTKCHPALNNLGKVAGRLHSMLTVSEKHREAFPRLPLISFVRILRYIS